jgi:NAD+ synthase
MGKTGIVTPISGGLDSSVVVSLCVKAVGKDNVVGLMLPERDGNDEAEKYARVIAQHLGIKTHKVNISRTMKAVGIYNSIICWIPFKSLRTSLARKFMQADGGNYYKKCREGKEGKFWQDVVTKQIARTYAKQRVRMLHAFKFADEHDLMVVGCAHKSEDLAGLFVKFGVDDNADLMPIKNLFRSHLLQLADHLGVPPEISGRSPNPDVVPGVTDKYLDILGVESERVDLIFYGLENNIDLGDIAKELGLSVEKVQEIKHTMDKSHYQRNPCLAPLF